jgi:hypothetical protein
MMVYVSGSEPLFVVVAVIVAVSWAALLTTLHVCHS